MASLPRSLDRTRRTILARRAMTCCEGFQCTRSPYSDHRSRRVLKRLTKMLRKIFAVALGGALGT